MKKVKDSQSKVIGIPAYLNKNCWLAKTLNYSPARRCQYCESEFRYCLFVQYLTISLVLTLFLFTLSFYIEERISKPVIISIFTLVIVYGYFFNKSTEKIIEANFAQRKAKEALEELAKGLESQVKQRTKQLQESQEELKKLDKARAEFLSIASHQLRTPLSIIKGYISMMLEKTYGKLPEKIVKPLENIYNSNERLIKLVNDLLSVSRIESGKMEMSFQKAYLEDIVSSVVKELNIRAKEKNIYLKWEKPTKTLSPMSLDQGKIRQAIFNIIDNAIQYTKEGGITVKLNRLPSFVQIQISDTGVGMNKEEISRVFESFARGSGGNRLSTEGVGLGLYVAKKFAETHKGRIWAESQGENKGSKFFIELPLT